MALPYEVETHYVARIEYLLDEDYSGESKYDRIQKFSHNLVREDESISVEWSGSGPCWWAYIVITGFDKANVEDVARKIYNYIKRFKGAKFA